MCIEHPSRDQTITDDSRARWLHLNADGATTNAGQAWSAFPCPISSPMSTRPPPRALCWPPRASSRICCEYRAAKTRSRGSHKQSKDGANGREGQRIVADPGSVPLTTAPTDHSLQRTRWTPSKQSCTAMYSTTSTALRSQKGLVTMSSRVPGPTVNRRGSVNSGAERMESQNHVLTSVS